MATLSSVYAQKHYESSLELFEKGLYDKALHQINKAIQYTPENADMQAMKGVFLQRLDRLIEAERAYKKALNISPDHSYSHFNLGIIRMQHGMPSEAIKEWQEVVNKTPDDIEALFNIGVALTHVNKWREATQFFEKILNIKPDHAFSCLNLAVIYREQSEYDKARFYFNQLKTLDNTYSEAAEIEIDKCNNLEVEERERFRRENQEMGLSYLMEDDSPLTKSLFYIAENKYDEALFIASEYLKDNNNSERGHILRGRALYGLKHIEKAFEEYNYALSINNRSTEAMFYMAEAFYDLKQYPKALELFEHIVSIDPNHMIAIKYIEDVKTKIGMA